MNAKDNTKTVPQCQRAQVEKYIQCTLWSGQETPPTAQDIEYGDIWRKTCSAVYSKANDECIGKPDYGDRCERERNDITMKCLLDNTKARASDFVHGICSARAMAAANDCVFNIQGTRLEQCQRQQWDAYPECVKKMAPQKPAAIEAAPQEPAVTGPARQNSTVIETAPQKPAVTGPARQNSTVTETAEDECNTSI